MTLDYILTASVLVIGLVIIYADARRKLTGSEYKKMSLLLIGATIVYVLSDCLWIVSYTAPEFNRTLFSVENAVFYLIYITLPYIWFQFAHQFAVSTERDVYRHILFAIPWCVNVLLVVLTLGGGGLLWSVGDGGDFRYERGPLFGLFSDLNLFYYFYPVLELFYVLVIKKAKERRKLLMTLGFALIPAVGVLIYTLFIPAEAIYPFQPSCFFIGVMFAYILLITQVQQRNEEERLRIEEEAKAALRIAELTESVTSLFVNMPALTFSKDVESGVYLACNQMFADYARKATPEEVVGLTDFDIFDEETARHFVEDDKKAIAMDEPYIFYEDVPDAAGEQRQFQTTKLKFTDTLGRLCTLGMCVDVTEMVSIKRESDEIRLQKEAADAQSRAKSEFLSNMSHEIRTPITAVLGMNEMILRESDDAAILGYAENIKTAGASLLGIISDILDFSKIEAGKMELEEEEYSLRELVADMYNLLRFRVEGKGLAMAFAVDEELPERLVGDALRLKQILMNLLTNAVKYTEKGSVRFEIALEEDGEDFALMYVAVTDTGIGIRDEDLRRLFVAFERLDAERTKSIEGTGLGLAITSKLLGMMGSELLVESAYEHGSTFYFYLRQKKIGKERVGVFDPTEQVSQTENGRCDRTTFTAPQARILIVDDTPMNLQVMASLLKRTGIQIDTAPGGRECLEAFGKNEYDMVFLDYRMPILDGIETLKELHRFYPERAAATPIVSLTASAVSGDKERMLEAGFTDYLSKPVNIERMEEMMIRYLPDHLVHIVTDDGTRQEPAADEAAQALPQELFAIEQLDVLRGVDYCGEPEDYLDALAIYAASISDKAKAIEENLAKEDMDAYVIAVHSLKSTSLAVGALGIHERAKLLEQAAEAGETALLLEQTPLLLEEYRSLGEALAGVVD